MPTFLDNSLSGLNRGWQQLYGQQANGPAVTSLYGAPAAQAAQPVAVAPAPVARNPEIGQPMGGADSPTPAQQDSPLTDYYSLLFGLPYIRRMAQSAANPAPLSYNPEVGQTLGAYDGSDSSGAGLLSNNSNNTLANLFMSIFNRGSQAPQMNSPGLPTGVSVAQPGSGYEQGLENMGAAGQWPTGSTVVPGQYVLGPSVDGQSGEILATGKDATATPGGGGGMSGAGMASSAIGAIGSGLSDIGKNISATKATYTAPNIPLPQRVQFVPPTLAPNRNV